MKIYRVEFVGMGTGKKIAYNEIYQLKRNLNAHLFEKQKRTCLW